jgi:hypothetical protein
MRPPLFTFLTFNRLGNTCISLESVLQSPDDFEMYIIDNGSKDFTWDYLNTIDDPRIKDRKRFDSNFGIAALNYALSFRKEDQDWVNVEPDTHIHNKNFISEFKKASEFYPEFGYFSGMLYGGDVPLTVISHDYVKTMVDTYPQTVIQRGQYRVWDSGVGMTGYCLYIPSNVMNQLMFLDEVSYGADVDLNCRIMKGLKKKAGFVFNIGCSMIGTDCKICLSYGNICPGQNICNKIYSRVTSTFIAKRGTWTTDVINQRISGKLPLKCDSIFGQQISDSDKAQSLKNIEELKNIYDEYLRTMGYQK